MKNIKKSLLIIILIIVGVFFIACAKEESKKAKGATTITMARFFGVCDETTMGVVDVKKATTECEVIQILTNKFNAENTQGITVERMGGGDWLSYYDALNASFASGSPPNVAVMHGSNLFDYASRNLLQEMDSNFIQKEINPDDWTSAARNAVTYENKIYGIPFDLHALVWHTNVDLFKKAGLLDGNGNPIIPKSTEELFEQARIIKEKTGKDYLATEAESAMTIRWFLSLLWQQNSDIFSKDGFVNINTEQAYNAVKIMADLFKDEYANKNHDYIASQQAFLNGDVAVLLNGNWAVDQYNRETKFNYRVTNLPTLYQTDAVWANSHIWVAPKGGSEETYNAAVVFLKFLYDHVGDWSVGTGHIPPRKSVLESGILSEIPQRDNYAETANLAHLVTSVKNWQAIEDILKEEINATWLIDADVKKALENAEKRITDKLGLKK